MALLLAVSILFGTLYPLIYEAYTGGKQISVGAPYFEFIIFAKLFNQIHPLQTCPQNTFIPDSKSELYNQHNYSNGMKIQFKNINKKEYFKPFNPNSCNLGTKMFNNHTRQQTKDL